MQNPPIYDRIIMTNTQWNINQAAQKLDDLLEKYRPKIIREYEENGHIVKVYEARHGAAIGGVWGVNWN